jgi:hypothetical protein
VAYEKPDLLVGELSFIGPVLRRVSFLGAMATDRGH